MDDIFTKNETILGCFCFRCAWSLNRPMMWCLQYSVYYPCWKIQLKPA